MSELQRVCNILDKLCLDALVLMEQYIENKLNLETSMCDGEAHLAKSRYIMGQNQVTPLQFPTAESSEINALATVNTVKDDNCYGQKTFQLEITKKSTAIENNEQYQDPLKWFGVLVPQDLHRAQAKYKQAVIWCVETANLQIRLMETCIKIKQLKAYKAKLLEVK